MKKVRRYANRVEAFLQSDNGQRFFNVAYSVGAAIVLWGALFQILHIRGGATLLCVGMGTEIFMFILTAFDRPPKEPNWDAIIPAINQDNRTQASFTGTPSGTHIEASGSSFPIVDDSKRFMEESEKIILQMERLQELLKTGNENYARQVAELNQNIAGLNSLYELQLKNISGQLSSMDHLNQGLKEMSETYEKSSQNSLKYYEETEKMTKYMEQINAVYSGMIGAMKGKE